jgi:hypothetical protein
MPASGVFRMIDTIEDAGLPDKEGHEGTTP